MLLQVDPDREFMGAVTQLMEKHSVRIKRGRIEIHRDQGVVERFNITLAERNKISTQIENGLRDYLWLSRHKTR